MRTWLAVAFGVVICGCGSDNKVANDVGGGPDAKIVVDRAVAQPDAPHITVGFKELKGYEVFKGQVTVKVEVSANVTKVELLGDTELFGCGAGKLCPRSKVIATQLTAPFDVTWDSTSLADRLLDISVKAYVGVAEATSTKLPVIIMNAGVEVPWSGGSSGKVTVPATGYVDQNLRYQWTMPGGVREIVGVITWDKPAFSLDLKVGAGQGPDVGLAATPLENVPTLAAVHYALSTGTIPAGETWYGRVVLKDPSAPQVLGNETSFQIKAYLLK